MKVALIFNSNFINWPLGGMLTYIKEVLPYLYGQFDLEIWGCSVDGEFNEKVTIGEKQYRVNKIANMRSAHKLVPNILLAIQSMIKMTKYIDAKNYDVIYFQESFYCAVYTLLRKNRRTKIAYHLHGALSNTPKRLLQIVSINRADLILENCDNQTIQMMKNKFCKKKELLFQMPSGIDTELFKPYFGDKEFLKRKMGYEGKDIFIYAGRFAKVKDVPLAVLAQEVYCKESGRDAVLLLIGDGKEKAKIVDLINERGLKKNVEIIEPVLREKLISFLQISDAFIMPSKGEGMSLSVLEAKACGVPVIGFDVSGIRDLISREKSGVLLEERKPQRVAQAMKYIINNKEKLSRGAREEAEQYSNKIIAQNIAGLIKKLG